VKASAQVVAEADGRNGTRLAVLRGESPLLLRRTGARTGAGVTLHLVGGAAGPLRGDDLRLEITVGPGAELEIRSVAAQLALPGRADLPPSRLELHASVAAGATLRWLPEPLIAAAGCDHHTVTHVEVAAGGVLLWRDDLVCGRHAEPSGNVKTTTTIRYAGKTLYRHDLSVGPAAPAWSAAAVLGSGRAVGTLVAAAPTSAALPLPASLLASPPAPQPASPPAPQPASPPVSQPASPPVSPSAALPASNGVVGDVALMRLAGPGVVITAVGADIRQVRAALDPLCAAGEGRAAAEPLAAAPLAAAVLAAERLAVEAGSARRGHASFPVTTRGA